MSKYGNSDNKNFSTSKYFSQSSMSDTTIRKNMSATVAESIKYTKPTFEHINTKATARYKKISSTDNQKQKYFASDNSIIQKRDSRIQKGLWDEIVGSVKDLIHQKPQKSEYESWLERTGRAANPKVSDVIAPSAEEATNAATYEQHAVHPEVLNAINQSRFARPSPSGTSGSSKYELGRIHVGDTPAGILATKRDIMFDRMGLTPRQQNRIMEFEDAMVIDNGPINRTIYPYQNMEVLRTANPHAHADIVRLRAESGKSPFAPLTEREATYLTPRYGYADYTGDFFTPDYTATKEYEDAWTSGGMLSPEELAIQPHTGIVRAQEGNLHPQSVTPAEKDFFDTYMDLGAEHPDTHNAYIRTLGNVSPADELKIRRDLKNIWTGEDTLQNVATDILDRKSKYGLYSEMPETKIPKTTVSETKVPQVNPTEKPSGWHEIDTGSDYGLDVPRESKPAKVSASNSSDYGFTTPIQSTAERNAARMKQLNTLYDEFAPEKTSSDVVPENTTKIPKKPFQFPKFTRNQKDAAAMALAIAAGGAAWWATQPKTNIPSVVQPSGRKIKYGGNAYVNPSDKVNAAFGTPSNDYYRPLMSGISGSGGAPVLDEKGNQVYVRSPFPFAPNESPYDKNGKLKGLTTRGREEMWRFGSDLYDPKLTNTKEHPGTWWAGKYTSVPEEYK